MMRKCKWMLLLICSWAYCGNAQPLQTSPSVHDPVLIRQDSMYYLFCTGRGISRWSSKDLKNWKPEKPVFDSAPRWAVEVISGFKNHIWAPDISFHNGLYYLYYSVSTFGKNTSCIGVATSPTLHPTDPAYHWTDRGKVICSAADKTYWNAIDPNLTTDEKGNPYLVFGSFWGGIKLLPLTSDRLQPAGNTENLTTIASRLPNDSSRATNPIEAPFIFKKGNWYYLFTSIDYCCKGINSTYKMIIGRSKKLEGPYVDEAGIPLAHGGGTIVLQGDTNWHGVGHNAVATLNGNDYLIFHGYDAHDNGRSKLRMEKLNWKNDWPQVQLADTASAQVLPLIFSIDANNKKQSSKILVH